MARNAEICITKEILFPWRGLLFKTVDPAELLRYLMQEGFFDNSTEADELQDNLRQNDLPRRELWEKLLVYLQKQSSDQPMHSFLHALKKAGYEMQENWIRNRSEQNVDMNSDKDKHEAFRKLLELFADQLCDTLDPHDLFPYFIEKKLLLDSHVEIIKKCVTHNQRVLSMLHYMTLSGRTDWPKLFIEVLLQAGKEHEPYRALAVEIEPKLAEHNPDDTLDAFTKANTLNNHISEVSSMEIEGAEIQGFTYGSPEVMNEAISFTEEHSDKNYNKSSEDEKVSSSSETALKRLNIEPANENVKNLSLTQVKVGDNSYAASVFSAEDNTSYPEACNILDHITVTAGYSDDNGTKRQRLENAELKLRAYQMELAQEPLNGFNTIIVAPTGTGKTLVAVYIAKVHLEAAAMKDNCVVFLVPYGHLVDQQESKFHQYLPGHNIVTLRGGDTAENQVPLAHLLEHNDVVLMTPQCLMNALNEEGPELMRHITLLFIDECHETKKEHACKKVMSVYLDAKLDKRIGNRPLPQVVGLTASVGVGSAKNKKTAEEHLLKLAANLDAQKIITVKENEADLEKYANEPKEGQELVEGRKNDPFKEKIISIMEQIESKIKLIPESEYVEDAPDLRKHLLKPIAARNMQQYMNWLSPFEQLAQKVDDNKLRRTFIAAKERLEVLHKGLQLNDDCESQYALEYIKATWNEPRFTGKRQLPAETKMHQLFQDNLYDLEDMCLMESQMNPKLTKLFEILEQEYLRNGGECRIIIFVRTRELTESLVKWVESQSSIANLRPKAIVGSAELTSPEQRQILEMFQKGDCQLLIATSVAEQGLDIAKCNIVIRYEYVTDDIGRVQARGRARAGNARHILVTERKIGLDFINFLKEGMMGEALQSISTMPFKKFQEKVKAFQKLDLEERRRIKCAEEAKSKMMRQKAKEFYILRCSKCNSYACNQEDLRIAMDAHRMVINREFGESYTYYESPTKKHFDGMEKKGKIYCKKCGRDWGVMFKYKQCEMPILKTTGFAITFKNEDGTEGRMTARHWRDIPIAVKDVQQDDLIAFLGGNNDSDGDGDDDN